MSLSMIAILFSWGLFVLVAMLVIRKIMGGKALDADQREPPENKDA